MGNTTKKQNIIENTSTLTENFEKIDSTYSIAGDSATTLLNKMEYDEAKEWRMFKEMDCRIEKNKYISNFHDFIRDETCECKFISAEIKQLTDKEHLLEKIIKEGIKLEIYEGLLKRIDDYIDLQCEIKGALEKEAFIYGFRSAYQMIEECRR